MGVFLTACLLCGGYLTGVAGVNAIQNAKRNRNYWPGYVDKEVDPTLSAEQRGYQRAVGFRVRVVDDAE